MGVIQKIYSTCHSTRKTPLPAICTCVGFLLDRWTTRVQGLLATVNPRVADLTPDPNATGRTFTGVALGSGMFSLAGAAHTQDDNKAAVSIKCVGETSYSHRKTQKRIWHSGVCREYRPGFFGVFPPYFSIDACPANKFSCMRSNLREGPAVGRLTFVLMVVFRGSFRGSCW